MPEVADSTQYKSGGNHILRPYKTEDNDKAPNFNFSTTSCFFVPFVMIGYVQGAQIIMDL